MKKWTPNQRVTAEIASPAFMEYLAGLERDIAAGGGGGGTGTVTSVNVSGGTTGLSASGGPVTTSGTITLGGTLAVANGGTGAATLTGYVKGAGTSPLTASATIPNTDIAGLGTMSTQAASAVAITGGAIDGTAIGAVTPVAGSFTAVSSGAGSAALPSYAFGSDPDTGMYSVAAGTLGWAVDGVARMNLTAAGRLNISSTTSFHPIITVANTTADVNPAVVRGNKSRAGAAVVSGDRTLLVAGQGSDGTNQFDAASIAMDVDAAPSVGIIPGRLVFNTSDSAGAQQERLRIASNGAWGLAGANYGIQGDTLTSGGPSAAPSWAGAEYWIAQEATYTLTSTTAAQKLFNATANGALTLPVGTYQYEALLYLTTMSATSGNGSFRLAGTATIASALSQAIGQDAAIGAGAAQGGSYWTGANSNAAIVTVAVNTALGVSVRGMFRVSVTGTVIPSIALTTASAAIVQPNSYFLVKRLSSSATATSFGPWS